MLKYLRMNKMMMVKMMDMITNMVQAKNKKEIKKANKNTFILINSIRKTMQLKWIILYFLYLSNLCKYPKRNIICLKI